MRKRINVDELHYKLVTKPRDVVRVQLTGNAANVLVMDDADYANSSRVLRTIIMAVITQEPQS
jgi:hypothetical protein